MKRVFSLLILLSLCKGVVSLEIAYIKEIDVIFASVPYANFCDDAQSIISGSDIINVQDGTKTRFDYSTYGLGQLNRFVGINRRDKFNREQRTLISMVHGTKFITKDVWERLKSHNRIYDFPNTYREKIWIKLYGNTGIQEGNMIMGIDLKNVEFFSGTQIIDLPVEIKYALGLGEVLSISVSYDLFTGVFAQIAYYDGTADTTYEQKLHIFNLIYDGTLTSKTEIRETPSHEGTIIGYLNERESVKVSEAENYEKREGYQDYWYYVTNDSYSGWCTGEFLLIEGGTWYNRFELRGQYVEWDKIPEIADITKIPLYGLITSDTSVYDELPSKDSLPREGVREILDASPSTESVKKDSVVEILDNTIFYDYIDGSRHDYYYFKIRLESGIEGWVEDDDIDVDLYGTKNLDTTGIPDEIDEIMETEIVDPENSEIHGIMNDTRVRLRSAPNLESETLEYLNTGDEVTVIEKTIEKYQVGDMEDYWYKVNKVKEGGYPTGWVYGVFVDFVERKEEIAEIEDTSDVPDITVTIDEKNTVIPWVIGGAVLLLGAIIGTVVFVKKKKS